MNNSNRCTEQAARVTGPKAAADNTGLTGVMRYALTGANQQVTLPTNSTVKGKKSNYGARFVRLLAMGANVQWAEGHGSAPTIVLNQTAAMGTGHVSAGVTLVNGVPEHVQISSEATHIAFVGDNSTTGFLEIHISDQPIV